MVGNLGDDRDCREGIAVEAAMSFYGAHANMVRGTFCGILKTGCGVREGGTADAARVCMGPMRTWCEERRSGKRISR